MENVGLHKCYHVSLLLDFSEPNVRYKYALESEPHERRTVSSMNTRDLDAGEGEEMGVPR